MTDIKQQAEPPTITTHESDLAFIGGGASYDLTAEPVAYRYKVRDHFGREVWTTDMIPPSKDVLETQPLYASPPLRITAEQVAELKRLADEYARSYIENGSALMDLAPHMYDRQCDKRDESRAALHAALDALVAKKE